MPMPGGDHDSEGGQGKRVEHVEIDGKLQPVQKGMAADLTIVEETLWKL